MSDLQITSTASYDVELTISVLDSENECEITTTSWESMCSVWIDKYRAIKIIAHLVEEFGL